MKKILFTVVCCLLSVIAVNAQRFGGYYNSLDGKKKEALKAAVHSAIQPKRVLDYGSGAGKTWTGFYRTDRLPDGQVVDRYCNDKRYFSSGDNAHSASAIGGMNIEHSFPKSWWGGASNNAYKDLFNLMPCESKINSSKSNYGMGVVTNAKTDNGCTKVGTGSAGGVNKSLWEPADKWKGDFARGYMYMATTYSNFTWEGEGLTMLENNAYPTFKKWAYELLLKWAKEDPVDEMEIARNDSVYKIQQNRNPFVDFPYLCEYIWGDSVNYAFDVNKTFMASSGHLPGDIDTGKDDTDKFVYNVTPLDIRLKAKPGEASDAAEVSVFTKDLKNPEVTMYVPEPFEVSLDGKTWKHELTSTSTYFKFKVRFSGTAKEGVYEEELSVANDEAGETIVSLVCTVAEGGDFFEDFEVGSKGSYAAATVKCSAATWNMNNALIGSTASDYPRDSKSVRIKSGGYIEMTTDAEFGCETLSFYAGRYGSDSGVSLTVAYSTDGGSTWKNIAEAIPMDAMKLYEYKVSTKSPVRLRFSSTGNRSIVDDVTMTPGVGETAVYSIPAKRRKSVSNRTVDLSGRQATSHSRIILVDGKKILK